MGTSRSGRYMNTKGSRRHSSDFALVHSKINFSVLYKKLPEPIRVLNSYDISNKQGKST